MEMNASKCIQTQLCHWLFNFDGVKIFLHDLIWEDLPALCCQCTACDLNTDLERAHPYDHSSVVPPLLDSFAIMLPSRGGNGCLQPPLLSIMCQTTDPLTNNSSHLLWNVLSQWLPLGLTSVEVRVWCLITFGRAIFCSSFQLKKPKKVNATSASSAQHSPGAVVFSCFQSFKKIFSSARFDTDAAFWRSKVMQHFFQFNHFLFQKRQVLSVFPRIRSFNCKKGSEMATGASWDT